ncbi:MAG: tetratricopeptide repeat protein [Nitrospinae bacterium]|nr:tetratricopeptide repeat protein [Nitrospinota bacterium]MBL7019527.1 tetratricopeptide repeat protein [Nitrospinaceae bacterium]
MSLKQIIVFLIFALLSIYTAFLNPHDSVVHITQNHSLKLPTVLLVLGSILVGVIVTVFLFWTFNFKNALARWKISFKNNQIEKKNIKVETLFKKGESLFICGKTDKAQRLIEKLLDTSPEHVGALNLMGRILSATGKPDQAEIFYEKALSLDPQNIHALFDLADIYSKTGRQSDEIALLQKMQGMNPGTVAPLLHLRNIYLKQEDFKKVCVLQKRILPLLRDNNEEWKKEQSNLGQYLVELGKKSLQTGNRDGAISEFKQAIRTCEQCLPAYLSLGDAYIESSKQKPALKIWKTGFQKTGDTACLVRSQIALRESEDYQDLLSTYEESLEATKDPSLLVLLLSTFYLEHGLEDKALSLLENNASQHPLLHALLLENARQSGNGKSSHFELTRDAIFALSTRRGAN